jgi:hypothetical protein
MGDGNDSTYRWNSTRGGCHNATDYNASQAMTAEWNATRDVQRGMGDVAEQFPTIGIIAVMVIIISLIAGVFVYMRFFR